MSGRCGVTGCAHGASTKCHWCSLPLCAEHTVPLVVEEGEVACCRGCAAYLKAKGAAGAKGNAGGDHVDDSERHDAQR